MFLMSVTESEIVSVLDEFSLNRSTDYIGLNMEIIRHFISFIVKPLCYIGDKSFLDGTFPDRMKTTKIIPICKSGDKD